MTHDIALDQSEDSILSRDHILTNERPGSMTHDIALHDTTEAARADTRHQGSIKATNCCCKWPYFIRYNSIHSYYDNIPVGDQFITFMVEWISSMIRYHG